MSGVGYIIRKSLVTPTCTYVTKKVATFILVNMMQWSSNTHVSHNNSSISTTFFQFLVVLIHFLVLSYAH